MENIDIFNLKCIEYKLDKNLITNLYSEKENFVYEFENLDIRYVVQKIENNELANGYLESLSKKYRITIKNKKVYQFNYLSVGIVRFTRYKTIKLRIQTQRQNINLPKYIERTLSKNKLQLRFENMKQIYLIIDSSEVIDLLDYFNSCYSNYIKEKYKSICAYCNNFH